MVTDEKVQVNVANLYHMQAGQILQAVLKFPIHKAYLTLCLDHWTESCPVHGYLCVFLFISNHSTFPSTQKF